MPKYSTINYPGTNFINKFKLEFWQQNRAWLLAALILSPVAGGAIGGALLALGALSTFIAPPFGLIAYLTVIGIGAGIAFAASAILSSWTYFTKRNTEEQNAIDNKAKQITDRYAPKEQPKIHHKTHPVQTIEKKLAEKGKEENFANPTTDSNEIEKIIVDIQNLIKKIDMTGSVLKESKAHSNVKDLILKLTAHKNKYENLIKSTSPSKVQSINMTTELSQLKNLTLLTVKNALLAIKQERLNIFIESQNLSQNEITSYKQRIKSDFTPISQDSREFSAMIESINQKFTIIESDIQQLARERKRTIHAAETVIQAAYQPQPEDSSELSEEKNHDEQAQTIINKLELKTKERIQELRTKLSNIEAKDLPSFLQSYLQQEKAAAEQYQNELIFKMMETNANTESHIKTSQTNSITPQSFFRPSFSPSTSGANLLDESDEAEYSDAKKI